MKYRYMMLFAVLVFAAFAFAPGAAAQDTRPEEEVVRFEEKVHDFGDILLSDKSVSCKFKFTNISKKPIVVHNVVSSCGCTVPTWTKEPIMPGKTGTIKVRYNTNTSPQSFTKTITVSSNSINAPRLTLKIKGTIVE